jgi:hypothetical protein
LRTQLNKKFHAYIYALTAVLVPEKLIFIALKAAISYLYVIDPKRKKLKIGAVMANKGNSGKSIRINPKDEVTILLGFISVVLFFIAAGFVAYWNTRTLNEDTRKVVHTHEIIIGLNDLVSLMKDAETSQRGYSLPAMKPTLRPIRPRRST